MMSNTPLSLPDRGLLLKGLTCPGLTLKSFLFGFALWFFGFFPHGNTLALCD